MTNYPEITFQRGAVEPVECLKAGWELIKDQYWLFVGLCAVGMIIGSAVPLGNLNGTNDVRMFLTFFRKRKRLPIEFGTMFKGFDYFGQSVVALFYTSSQSWASSSQPTFFSTLVCLPPCSRRPPQEKMRHRLQG
jgi:hypothetical protein